jgi:hypothetical protein
MPHPNLTCTLGIEAPVPSACPSKLPLRSCVCCTTVSFCLNASSVASAGPQGGWPPSPPTNAFSTPEPARSFTGCSCDLEMHIPRLHTVHRRIYSLLYLQAAVSNLQGGWLPPSPPAIAINVRSYACFFCSSPANDTGLLLQQPCKRHWCKRIGTTLRGTAEHTPAPSLNASFKAKLDPECSLKSLRGLSCPFCAAPLAPRLCNQRTKLHLV